MPVDELLARRFGMAEAVRWDDMPEDIFRDWVIDHYDMCGVIASHIDTPPDDWMRDGWQAVMRWPVVSVKFVGRKPRFSYETSTWDWWDVEFPSTIDADELRPNLTRYFSLANPERYGLGRCWEFASEEDAYDDLSRAAVRWACDKAAQECGEMMVC